MIGSIQFQNVLTIWHQLVRVLLHSSILHTKLDLDCLENNIIVPIFIYVVRKRATSHICLLRLHCRKLFN